MPSYPYICMLFFFILMHGFRYGHVGGAKWEEVMGGVGWGGRVDPMLTNHILAQKVMFGDAAKP